MLYSKCMWSEKLQPHTTQTNPLGSRVPNLSHYFPKIHSNTIFSFQLFPSCFSTKIFYTFLNSSMRATCPTYLILDLITIIINGEAYKLWSSLCSLLQPLDTSSLLCPKILLSTLFSNTFIIGRSIQKFPDCVNNEIKTNTRSEATQRVMAAKLTRLTHKITIQLHLMAETCTIRSSSSRMPVRKLLDMPSHDLPLLWETKFRTHKKKKKRQNIHHYTFNIHTTSINTKHVNSCVNVTSNPNTLQCILISSCPLGPGRSRSDQSYNSPDAQRSYDCCRISWRTFVVFLRDGRDGALTEQDTNTSFFLHHPRSIPSRTPVLKT
jgi:hypothetical protein